MGTRNITRVISNGIIRVNQYCQWDGYPTNAGSDVLEFVKNADMEEFQAKVEACSFTVCGEGTPHTYSGVPLDSDLGGIFKTEAEFLYKGEGTFDERMAKKDAAILSRHGEEGFKKYRVASRDTGVDILSDILNFSPMNLYTDTYCLMEDTDWQIEAINVIDLDEKEVRMIWHGLRKTVKFSEIPEMNIEKEMENFEREEDEPVKALCE